MQIFEVVELNEYPYMMTKEIYDGEIVRDVIKDDKVYLMVDHDLNRIWTYNGYKSSFKLQMYGVKLAEMLSRQLMLKYNIYPLNRFTEKDERFQELMEKSLGGGIAQAIGKQDFLEFADGFKVKADVKIIPDINVKNALEYINEIPHPEKFIRKFMIVGGNIYTDEEITESFITVEKTIEIPLKLGRLNRGFTFFSDYNYSTRVIINDRQIQGIELYIHEKDKAKIPILKLKIPIFSEERFSNAGDISNVETAFKIPDDVPEEVKNQNLIQDQKDS